MSGMALRKEDERFSYAQYLTWDDGKRWELIDGLVFDIAPGPGIEHQDILLSLGTLFKIFLKGKPCRPFIAPFDLILPDRPDDPDSAIFDVVQPDLMVVCDPKKITPRGIRGAPDLVVEILSPSSSARDLREKFDLYQHAGVREYWVISPHDRFVQVFTLGTDRRYGAPVVWTPGDRFSAGVLPDLVIDLSEVFPPDPDALSPSPGPETPPRKARGPSPHSMPPESPRTSKNS